MGSIVWVVLIAIYLTPSLVAWGRGHRSLGSVVVVDVLLGWTFIGWVVALAMAFSSNVEPKTAAGPEPAKFDTITGERITSNFDPRTGKRLTP